MLDKLRSLSANKKGFTLIEVVIVLAIAGLIFVVVFLAVQGAQRGRRDSERQAAAGRLIAAVDQYSSNNNGALPANCAAFTTYYNDQGGTYPCTNVATSPDATNSGRMEYGPDRECSGTNTFATKTRVAAVRYWSESGAAVRCTDND